MDKKNLQNPKIVDYLAYKTIGDETIILDSKINQQVHHLDITGSFIWNLCDGQHSILEIINEVCLEFEVENDVASEDVHAFLVELQEKKLLEDLNL